MVIPQEQLNLFQAIYKKREGIVITEREALEIAILILDVVNVLYPYSDIKSDMVLDKLTRERPL